MHIESVTVQDVIFLAEEVARNPEARNPEARNRAGNITIRNDITHLNIFENRISNRYKDDLTIAYIISNPSYTSRPPLYE